MTFLDENIIFHGTNAFAGNNLKNFYLNAQMRLSIKNAKENISSYDTEDCTLYVPIGRTGSFDIDEPWCKFKKIVEYDFDKLTGIDKVTTDSDNQGDAHEVARYSINGQRLNASTQGINIVKYSDGTTKKVMVP